MSKATAANPGSPDALDRIAFVAQDAPLYKNLPAGDMLHVAANLNTRWDQGYATARLERLAIPLRQKVGELSGGQKAQLALTVALARRPVLLVLDEPLAALDPVARTTSWPRWSRRRSGTASPWCSPRTCSPSSSGSPPT
jgi:ABC-type multidrug transport system ATPase subunit